MSRISSYAHYGVGNGIMIAFERLHEAVFVCPQHPGDTNRIIEHACSLNDRIELCQITIEQ